MWMTSKLSDLKLTCQSIRRSLMIIQILLKCTMGRHKKLRNSREEDLLRFFRLSMGIKPRTNWIFLLFQVFPTIWNGTRKKSSSTIQITENVWFSIFESCTNVCIKGGKGPEFLKYLQWNFQMALRALNFSNLVVKKRFFIKKNIKLKAEKLKNAFSML